MSEWLPFVGFTKEVRYDEKNSWRAYNSEKSEYEQALSLLEKTRKDVIFQRATNVSASVSKVDDFSYRFTVRFRHLIPRFVTSDFRYEDYAIFLVKGTYEPNFFRGKTESDATNKNYLLGDFYLFGYPGMYNNITAKQVEGTLHNLYDVEYSGVQVVRECFEKSGGILISRIWQ